MVIPNLFLFGIEADTLADDGRFWTGGTPDSEGHFKPDGENTLAGFASARSQGMFVCSKPKPGSRGKGKTYLPANLLAEVVPSCSGGT